MNRFLFFIILSFIISACGASSSAAPVQPAATNELPVVVATSQVVEEVIPLPPAITETRRLTLEYPPKMKAGVESEIVILTLEVDDLGNLTSTAQFDGNVVTGEVIEIPDLYETHKVTVEARLDLAGIQVSPSGATFEPLNQGGSAKFSWSIRPEDPGNYRGTVWLHLNFEEKLTGEKSRIAVSAQVVEIEAVDFFGLSTSFARTSGVLGSVIGGIVGFPFLQDIIKFLFRKKPKK